MEIHFTDKKKMILFVYFILCSLFYMGIGMSDEINDYYIKLEELLQETIMAQTDELHIQLEQKKVSEEKTIYF